MTYDDSARELELRERAIKQLKKRRDFRGHLMVYVLVNSFLVVIWAVTSGPGNFFWPVFVLGGWGIGLVANFYDVYIADDISEAEIRRQMEVLSRR
jgi:hypothetical protein